MSHICCETDLDEVVQTPVVFLNVARGLSASTEDIHKAFGDEMTEEQLVKLILSRGDAQVTNQERKALIESRIREVSTLVSQRTVNPLLQPPVPYPVPVIRRAMTELLSYRVNFRQPVSAQAAYVIKKLKDLVPLEEAQMLVSVELPSAQMQGFLASHKDTVEVLGRPAHYGDTAVVQVLIEPGLFKSIKDTVAAVGKGLGTVQLQKTFTSR
ncbi:hypothetical protein KIPB_006891 [Kipferlia bialata]|uniref:Ribosome maturation protein SBDS n=1 Tax=Kipferlia bialata TaxID=797122 RepID=A0A9K3CZ68_9EUKA|nr:hypothetical protein KIPB_006891 [Kipferlia bialata]|eukprot:g6891.t1